MTRAVLVMKEKENKIYIKYLHVWNLLLTTGNGGAKFGLVNYYLLDFILVPFWFLRMSHVTQR